MTIKIDRNKCISCGLCVSIAPKFFQIDKKTGKAEVIKQPEKVNKEIKRAINNCPVQAIKNA